jgi:Tfp pilus assembly protein PilF
MAATLGHRPRRRVSGAKETAMRRLLILLACTLLGACAQVPLPPPLPVPLEDAQFTPPATPIDPARVFALSDEMRRYAHDHLAQRLRQDGRRGLLMSLYQRRELQLDYDSTRTLSAQEAFEARRGNCLSLVIMTAALAKELDVPVTYQSAVMDDTWSRDGDLYFSIGHVNLLLGRRDKATRTLWDDEAYLVVDFLPAAEIRGLRTEAISESRVISMYMNNRAAETLAQGSVDDAYWFAREAIRQDPGFLPAYNTLGVIYQRHGLLAQAEQVFAQVLSKSPANPQALANEVAVLHQLGRDAEAAPLARRLAKAEPYPPFYFFDRGLQAMQHRDYKDARALFEKEIGRTGDYHEFHFWLSIADFELGDLGAARKEMEAAMDASTKRSDHDLYAAKLERLEAYRRQ